MQKVTEKKKEVKNGKIVEVSPELQGARLVLAGAGINPETVGFTNKQVIETAKTIQRVRLEESRETKKVKFRTFKENVLTPDFVSFVKALPNKQDLATEAAGSSPAGTIGSWSDTLDDGRKIATRVTAIRLDPDNEKLKELKTQKDLMAEKVGNIAKGVGLGKIADLLAFEAGTRDNKSISLFTTDVKKPDCIKDGEFKYQVSVQLMPDVEDDPCKGKSEDDPITKTILRKKADQVEFDVENMIDDAITDTK